MEEIDKGRVVPELAGRKSRPSLGQEASEQVVDSVISGHPLCVGYRQRALRRHEERPSTIRRCARH
jgi:hypothetical protein